MENTSALMFDKEHEKYFLAIEGKALGPMTAQNVYERIQQGEVNLLHYIWMEGASDWKRICDQKDFAVLIPQKPSAQSIQSIKDKLAKKRATKAPPTPDSEPKQIYLYYGSTQYGPFSKPEVEHVLRTHHLSRSAYLWIPGWANWKRLADQPEYADFFNEAPPAPPSTKKQARAEKSAPSLEISSSSLKKKNKEVSKKIKTAKVELADGKNSADEKRGAPRRPLVARLFLHNDQDVIIAVCRDISIGGMQVLTDRVPGPVGSKLKLNVSPGDPSKVKGFVAEGEIVRVLEDGRGFSFRFRKITEEARRTIEKYITEE